MSAKAECRGCHRELRGSPYHKGGSAYVPGTETKRRPSGVRALAHHFGGWVCSANCNRRVFKDMEPQCYSSEYPRMIAAAYAYFDNPDN